MSDRRFKSMLMRIRRRFVLTRAVPGAEPRAVLRFGDRVVHSPGDHRDLSPRELELVDMEAELDRLARRTGRSETR